MKKVLLWALDVILLLFVISMFATGGILSGIIFLSIAVLTNPIFNQKILRVNFKFKIPAFIILFFIGMLCCPASKKDVLETAENVSSVVESSSLESFEDSSSESVEDTTISETTIITSEVLQEPSNHNTSKYVDYLYYKAKQDLPNVTQQQIDEATDYVIDNIDNLFKDNQTMENVMYNGYLIEQYYKETNESKAEVGFMIYKTIKYVYRSAETVEDESTQMSLQKLKKLLNIPVETTTTTVITTAPPTEPPATAPPATEPPATIKQTVPAVDPSQRTVYIAASGEGKKYHTNSDCSGMNGEVIALTIAEAEAQGYEPCKKCD